MDLPLCVLLGVIILCFILLIVVSGIRFKFHVTRETFQDHPETQTAELPGPVEKPENVHTVRNIKDTPAEDRLSVLHDNECKPECCSSGRGNSYSCSTGCVCVSDANVDLITSRGGNHTAPCL